MALSAPGEFGSAEVVSENVLPGVHGPAFYANSLILFHDEHGLEVETGAGNVQAIPLAVPDVSVERMSSSSFHLFSPSTKQNWVLHLDGAAASLAVLPEKPTAASAASATAAQGDAK